MDLHPMLLFSCYRALCFSMMIVSLSLTWTPATTLATPLTKCPCGRVVVKLKQRNTTFPGFPLEFQRRQCGDPMLGKGFPAAPQGRMNSCFIRHEFKEEEREMVVITSSYNDYGSWEEQMTGLNISVFYWGTESHTSLFMRCSSVEQCNDFLMNPLDVTTNNFSSAEYHPEYRPEFLKIRERLLIFNRANEILKARKIAAAPGTLPEDDGFIKELEFDLSHKSSTVEACPALDQPETTLEKPDCNCRPVCPSEAPLGNLLSCECHCCPKAELDALLGKNAAQLSLLLVLSVVLVA